VVEDFGKRWFNSNGAALWNNLSYEAKNYPIPKGLQNDY
jgi:hypothetical protein